MKKILIIVEQELKNHFSRTSYLIMSFGLPVIAIVLITGIILINNDTSETKETVFDLPDKPIGYNDYSGLFDYPGLYGRYLIKYSDESKAINDAENGKITSFYVIPLEYITTGNIDRYSTQFNLIESDTALIEAFLVSAMLRKDNPQLLARLQSPINLLEYQLDQSGELVRERKGDSSSNFWLVYVFSIAFMIPVFFSASHLTRSVILEKENRMIEIVLTSLRPIQILAGKVIGNGTAGLIQFISWLTALLVVIKISSGEIPFLGEVKLPPWTGVIALLYFIGGYTLFAAFSSGIGAISSNMREGPQFAIFYTLPASLPLFFISSIAESPNGVIAILLSVFPLSAPLGMIGRILITNVPIWQIGASLVLLFTSIGFALWFASRLFQVNTLLAGKLVDRKTILQLLDIFHDRSFS